MRRMLYREIIIRHFICIVCCILISDISFATNILWQAQVDLHCSNQTVCASFQELERQSKEIDPTGKGVCIVAPPYIREQVITNLNMNNVSLFEMLLVLTSYANAGNDIVLIDNVALICMRQTDEVPIIRTAGISGNITDATDQTPVTNAVFSTVICPTNRLVINENGSYVANIQYQVRRPFVFNTIIYDDKDDEVNVTVYAKGYYPNHLKLFLGDNKAIKPTHIIMKPLVKGAEGSDAQPKPAWVSLDKKEKGAEPNSARNNYSSAK